MAADPQFLTLDEVIALHSDQIHRYGGLPGLRDMALLSSALGAPRATFGGEFLHPDLFEMAAAYLFHLVKNHPFLDGNKRVGLAAALIFLWMNDQKIDAEEFKSLRSRIGSCGRPRYKSRGCSLPPRARSALIACVILGSSTRCTKMPKITLEVPSDVVDAFRLPPQEVEDEIRRELAVALYRRGVLSLGKARLLAQMNHWQIDQLLSERRIPRHYTGSDLAEDSQHAHGRL